jgi:hypothetical protein
MAFKAFLSSPQALRKHCTYGLFRLFYALAVTHVLTKEEPVLKLDEKSSNMIAVVENAAKEAALAYTVRLQRESATDPMTYYLNGKLDGKIVTNITESWLERQLLLKSLFPEYEIQWSTHAIDGRIGIWKALFQAAERRGVINHVLNNLFLSKGLWSRTHGQDALPPRMSYVKKGRSSTQELAEEDLGDAPPDALALEKSLLQEVYLSNEEGVVRPEVTLPKVQRKGGKANYKYASSLIPLFSKLSTEYSLVSGVGYAANKDNPDELAWTEFSVGSEIVPVNFRTLAAVGRKGKGRSGGRKSTPCLKVLPREDPRVVDFLRPV